MNAFRSLKVASLFALAAAAVLPALAAPPVSGATSTVIYVSGDDVVLKASDGKVLNFATVPASYKFMADGKSVTVAELKPGAKLTAPVATGFDPTVVASIAVVKAKVYATTPPDAITLILPDGSKDFSVPAGTKFTVGGASTALAGVKADSMIEATIVTPATDGADVPAPSTPAMVGALLVAKTDDLPAAGTHLPSYGVAGLALLVIGFGLMMIRRPAMQS